ncbi:SCO family protein [Halioglobus japonicus]|uniref:SCO family protein n=1 Tax=Halioglobus japonicus TaxID=930805 RepID=A0AAP8MCG2_9GAMM|nr:SCO family protein [Halioglobus japonicus]AQA17296.1 SCO family protein [Halioglobus japonicus]PLW85220.1 SCO family protein [Halioglobus japonicus]GHD24021.1 cytochrome c oxidase assembly protein [Halioglobus japonicus]
MTDQTQRRNIRFTVVVVLLFITVIVAGFVYRIQQPRVMSVTEMKVNGLYLHENPRNFGEISLIDHHGEVFDRSRFEGKWSLVFFGFTYCPDVCPTTMAFLDQFMAQLEGTEAEDTQVVMVSVDPARDTVEQLSQYVPYFNPDFIGVTGEFLDVHRFATALNTPFRKVPGQDENYLVDHSSNVVLVNPKGDYHGFFKAPLDQAKMKVTYRSARVHWDY